MKLKKFNEMLDPLGSWGKESKETFKKGEIVIRPKYAVYSDGMYLLLENADENSNKTKVIFVGTISKDSSGELNASFIFNTKDNNPGFIANNSKDFTSYRKATPQEKKLINISLDKKIYEKYLNYIEEKTGIRIEKQN